MVVLAAETAKTCPVALTVATSVFPLLHVPPLVPDASLRVEENPTQALSVPVMAPAVTVEFTVTLRVVESLLQLP